MDFYDNSDGNKLDAAKKHHHAQDKNGAPPNIVTHEFDHQEIKIDQHATDKQENPGVAKQVHGLLHVFFKKEHQQQIADDLEGAAQAIFGCTKLAGVVLHVYLGDASTFEVGEYGHKTVQFPV